MPPLLHGAAVTNVNQNDTSVSVLTANGTTFDADYLIVTVPLGVLKNRSIHFSPPLLPEKEGAINDMVGRTVTVWLAADLQLYS